MSGPQRSPILLLQEPLHIASSLSACNSFVFHQQAAAALATPRRIPAEKPSKRMIRELSVDPVTMRETLALTYPPVEKNLDPNRRCQKQFPRESQGNQHSRAQNLMISIFHRPMRRMNAPKKKGSPKRSATSMARAPVNYEVTLDTNPNIV